MEKGREEYMWLVMEDHRSGTKEYQLGWSKYTSTYSVIRKDKFWGIGVGGGGVE
jgi:hypothetical protein